VSTEAITGIDRLGGKPAVPEHLLRPHQQQVPQQDGAATAEGAGIAAQRPRRMQGGELPMGGRLSATGVGGVHHVVVHQCADVQHVEARGSPDQCGRVPRHPGDRYPTPRAERRTEPLPACGEALGQIGQRRHIRPDPGQHLALPGQEVGDRLGDGGHELVGNRDSGREHAPSLRCRRVPRRTLGKLAESR
jgi:hypothetical protein